MAIFAYCKYIKYAYLHRGGGRKVQKAKKYAYVIYEWSLKKMFVKKNVMISL